MLLIVLIHGFPFDAMMWRHPGGLLSGGKWPDGDYAEFAGFWRDGGVGAGEDDD